MRKTSSRILKRAGCSPMLAEDGEAAVEIFRQHSDEIDCVLLDFTMPKLNGEETFRMLKSIQPDVRVVLISGYGERDMSNRFEGLGFSGYLQKPASADRIVEALNAAIQEEQG